jgi:hypothetical protein
MMSQLRLNQTNISHRAGSVVFEPIPCANYLQQRARTSAKKQMQGRTPVVALVVGEHQHGGKYAAGSNEGPFDRSTKPSTIPGCMRPAVGSPTAPYERSDALPTDRGPTSRSRCSSPTRKSQPTAFRIRLRGRHRKRVVSRIVTAGVVVWRSVISRAVLHRLDARRDLPGPLGGAGAGSVRHGNRRRCRHCRACRPAAGPADSPAQVVRRPPLRRPTAGSGGADTRRNQRHQAPSRQVAVPSRWPAKPPARPQLCRPGVSRTGSRAGIGVSTGRTRGAAEAGEGSAAIGDITPHGCCSNARRTRRRPGGLDAGGHV